MLTIKRKPRFLWSTEASFLNTGFSQISRAVLGILAKRGNIEVAELSSYTGQDARFADLPWKCYPVETDNPEIRQRTQSTVLHKIYHQFGSAAMEYAILDFRPDILFNHRDFWMSCSFELFSPYRKHFNYWICPTIDGEPQRDRWLGDYALADKIYTYIEYGKETLERENPKVTVSDILRPGVDPDVFKIIGPKEKAKEILGLDPKWNIILTVMRNQKRKLFPDLIESFANLLKKYITTGQEELAKNTYLYLHTSFVDVGFDIQKFIRDHGVGHRVLTTYICNACGGAFASHSQGEITICNKCGAYSAQTSGTGKGVTNDQLNIIYNSADAYVQYAIAEGLSCPLVEARAAGTVAFAPKYSAMASQAKQPACIGYEISDYAWESVVETEQRRCIPSRVDLVDKLYSFFVNQNQGERRRLGEEGSKFVHKHCSFGRTADIIERDIFETSFVDHSLTWLKPQLNLIQINTNVPPNLDNRQFVDWCIVNIINRPDFLPTYWRDENVRSIETGHRFLEGTRQGERFSREDCFKMFVTIAQEYNYFEKLRYQKALGLEQNQSNLVVV